MKCNFYFKDLKLRSDKTCFTVQHLDFFFQNQTEMSVRSLHTNQKSLENSHRKLCRQRSNSEPNLPSACNVGVNAVDNKGRTRLFHAARNGQTEMARSLLEDGCDPNISDCNRTTALHEAVDKSHTDIVKLLTKSGCDLDMKNILGQTPLMRAVIFDDIEVVKILQRAGCKLDETDCTGKTALLHGLQEHRYKVCSYLIRNGSDVNIVDILGQSALSLAAQLDTEASASICKKLLRAGYDIHKDSDWLDESHVKSRVFRRPSFLKRICGLLGIKTVKIAKRKYEKEPIPVIMDNSDSKILRVRN